MTSPNLQEIILEYAWTHKMKDLQEGLHLFTLIDFFIHCCFNGSYDV